MPHADELILAGRDAERDSATELFLREHLRECTTCRVLQRKVERAERLIAASEPPVTAIPRRRIAAAPRRLGRAAVAASAVVIVVAAALAGNALRERRSTDGVAGTAAAPDPTISFEIKPVPPWRTSGTGRAAWTSKGDLLVEVSVRGPESEVSRTDVGFGRANFIWHLVAGSCASSQRGEPGNKVLARWTVEPKQADLQEFRYLIAKNDLDDMRRPHALAAFRNGGSGPLYACGDIQSFAGSVAAGPTAKPATATTPVVPADWQIVTLHDLRVPIPRGWTKTIDTVGKSDRPEPDPPQILYFEDKAADPAIGARRISIWIWPSPSVDELVRTRFVEGNLSFISQAKVPSSRSVREVVGRASWSGPSGAGTYRARHLLVQLDAERVVDVVVVGPQVPSTESEPTPEMRRIQEIVVHNVEALPATGCPRTRSTDASGVITANDAIGILDRTDASATSDDAFVMLKRGAALGDRVSVEFRQLGSSAPATSVSYGVAADPRPTPAGVRPLPWGEVAFKLGVKPIGFANSCWRLLVDGVDSGIVLFVGP